MRADVALPRDVSGRAGSPVLHARLTPIEYETIMTPPAALAA